MTLTTGTALMNNGNLDGFRVQRGVIDISGAGMDSSQADYTDLIARAVQVNAGLWANTLKVTTGANDVSLDQSTVTTTVASGSAPVYGIDTAALGGMYAGKITLVGTEAGVGVRNLGTIGASAGDVIVTADGRLENAGHISASGNIQTDTHAGVVNNGSVYAQAETRLSTAGTLNNSGTLAARGNTTLTAAQVNSQSGSVLAAGLNSDGTLAGDGVLTVSASGALTAQGQNLAGSAVALSGSKLDLSHSQTGAQTLNLQAQNGDLNATGATLAATAQLQARSSGLLRTDAATVNAPQLTLSAHDLSNVSGQLLQTGSSDLTLTTAGDIDNTQGRIGSNSTNLTVQAATLSNQNGRLEHSGSGTLDVSAQTLNGQGGSILSAHALNLHGGQIDISGGQTGADQIAINAASLSNANGKIVQSGQGTMAISALDALGNPHGLINTAGQLVLTSGSLQNQNGQITAADTTQLRVQGLLDNNAGVVAANGALGLTVGSLDNGAGRIGSVRAGIHLDSVAEIDNGAGQINAAQNIALQATTLNNQNGQIIGRDLAVRSAATHMLDNRGGTLGARGRLDLHSGALDNTTGLIQADQALNIDTQGQALINQQSGTERGIISRAALTLNTGWLDNQAGFVGAEQIATIHATALDNRAGGTVSANGALHLGADQIDNQGGQLQAAADLDLAARDGHIDNSGGGLINAGGTLRLTAAALRNHETRGKDQGIQARAIQIVADQIDNQSGAIYADTDLDIASHGVLDNRSGVLSGQHLFIADRDSGSVQLTIANAGGSMVAAQRIDIRSASLAGAGTLASNGDLVLDLMQDFVSDGTVSVQHNVDLRVTGRLRNSGSVSAGKALHIRAASLDNQYSGELDGAQNTLDVQGALSNRGLIDGGAVRVNAVRIDNIGAGRIYGDHIALGADALVNQAEAEAAAVIAARSSMDLGVGSLINRDHALIFADGNLDIGGALSAAGHATGQARDIYNGSAQIQAMGNLRLAAGGIINDNLHLDIAPVVVDVSAHEEYLIRVDPRRYDVSEVYKKHDQVDIIHPINCGEPCIKKSTGNYDDFIQYLFIRSVSEDRILGSDPGVISAGGNIKLNTASLQNNQSRLLAGNTLEGTVGSVHNNATLGHKIIVDDGTEQHFYRFVLPKDDDQVRDPALHYAPPAIISDVPLVAWQQQEHAVISAAGQPAVQTTAPAAAAVAGVGTVTVQDRASAAATRTSATEIPSAAPGTPTVIRTIGPDTKVPDNALFRLNPQGQRGYLIETDPRFASYKTWLSSDYLLQQLQYDPALTQKRLGDGFYEQKLVREQIAQLTGRRFLDGYNDDQAQYQALLNNGVAMAKSWNLAPGIALSPAQIAQLTADVVWLVTQDVTLPDGSITRALVPQVYVRVKQGDIDGNGALIGGNNVNLTASADVMNSGTIAGRDVLTLTAQNVQNLNGRISADRVGVRAANDLNNLGGMIDAANQLGVMAGRDINITTTMRSGSNVQGSATQVASAGRDVALLAGQIANRGAGGQTLISAGHDLNLNAQTTGSSHSARYSPDAWRNQSDTQALGSTVSGHGDLQLRAGHDINARAAEVSSSKGQLQATAGHDINLGAAENTTQFDTGSKIKERMRFSKGSTTHYDALDRTTQSGTTFNGDTLDLRAGNDLNITGSNAVSDNGTTIRAGHDVNIVSSIDSSSEQHTSKTRRSGFFSNGGLSLTYGKQTQNVDGTSAEQAANASMVGASHGDVIISGGNAYRQEGGNVLAPQGDIGIYARKVDIGAAREASKASQQTEFKQSGLTVAINNPVLAAAQTAQQMAGAAKQSGNARVQTLAGAATALAAINSYDAVKADPGNAGGINVSIAYGQSKSESKTTQSGSTAAGSKVAAGGDVIIKATGAGADSKLTVQDSDIKGGGNVLLKADGSVNLLAASNTNEQHSDSRNQSAGVGVTLSYGKNGAAFGVTANAAVGRGGSDGTDQSWTNSHISAGKTVGIDSGGDANIKGAVVSGNQVVADVGGNLNIESLQDTHKYDSKDQQVSGSVTVGYGFSASANASQQKMNSDYASVTEQSGIKAGDGGFQVNVKGNTDLKGGVIESSQAAIDSKANSFTTGTLTYSDIENHAHYSATSVGIGGGYSQGGGGMKSLSQGDGGSGSSSSNNGGVGKDQNGDVASAGTKVPGSGNKSGFSTGTPIVMAASGDSGSITRSGISAGSLTITDEAGQLAKTGMTAAETLASLDTTASTDKDTTGALKPIFDKTQIEAGFTVAKSLINETNTYVGNRIAEAEQKKNQGLDPDAKSTDGKPLTLEERASLLADSAALQKAWGPDGTERQIVGALTAALAGNVTGSSAALVQNGAINYLQSLATNQVKGIADQLHDDTARAALQGIVGCAGAAATSQSCSAGALGASSSVLLNKLLDIANNVDATTLSPAEKEDRINTVQTLITGIAAASGMGSGTVAASTAARTESENNAVAIPGPTGAGIVSGAIQAQQTWLDLVKGSDGLDGTGAPRLTLPATPGLSQQINAMQSGIIALLSKSFSTDVTVQSIMSQFNLPAMARAYLEAYTNALVQPAHDPGNTSPPGQNVPVTDKNKGVLVNNATGQNGATILANPGQTSVGNGIIATPNNGPVLTDPAILNVKFPSKEELARQLGTTADDFHKNVKQDIKEDLDPEMRKIGADNPDIGITKDGNIVLKNPKTGKTIITDIPLDNYRK
ncbi:hemagglutinin repeat-containing protein [Amantichitinum ursilacus]|uniref:Filamentous hemagglutinin n=1 Tax=Amantichitinum ursilacus TaxID=857265 RepID=A0A0N0GLV7_9NEIS|nr:hemagglutinin repeat-containing protein [Amantichitinum ursilacus]KPC50486.1 Filamentous hemagglutinin [Amantichitinum ursilacus]